MSKAQAMSADLAEARERWLFASECATKIATNLFLPGAANTDPATRSADEHRLHLAKQEAERLFREYHDLDKRETERKMFDLQNSQRLATWASFTVAAMVGVATIADIVMRALNE